MLKKKPNKFPKITNKRLYLSILQIYVQLPKISVLTSQVTEIPKILRNQLIIYKNTGNSFRSMPKNFKHTNRL